MSQGWRISVKIGVIKVPLITGRVKAFVILLTGGVVISGIVEPLVITEASLKLLRNGTASFNKINHSMDRHLELNMILQNIGQFKDSNSW